MNSKIFLLLIVLVIGVFSCTVSKESYSLRAEKRKAERLAAQVAIKKAIESRRFVLKMDKIILPDGLMVDLVPRNNFIIINGEIISVSLGYAGRSFGARQISGINFNGRTGRYLMKSDEAKGIYNIQVEAITPNKDKFDIYLTLGENGYCSASVNNPYIQSVSYRGVLVPLSPENVSYSIRK